MQQTGDRCCKKFAGRAINSPKKFLSDDCAESVLVVREKDPGVLA
jgi:hypothetical protein